MVSCVRVSPCVFSLLSECVRVCDRSIVKGTSNQHGQEVSKAFRGRRVSDQSRAGFIIPTDTRDISMTETVVRVYYARCGLLGGKAN